MRLETPLLEFAKPSLDLPNRSSHLGSAWAGVPLREPLSAFVALELVGVAVPPLRGGRRWAREFRYCGSNSPHLLESRGPPRQLRPRAGAQAAPGRIKKQLQTEVSALVLPFSGK